jgi:hypothetical protein
MSATIPKCARPPEPVTALGICFPRFSNCGTPDSSMIDEEIGMPAKRELSVRRLRHLLLASPRSSERVRDRATTWRGALHDPGQSETGGGGRVGMAPGGRRHGRRSGAAPLWARRGRARPAAAGQAGLGGLRASRSVLASRSLSAGRNTERPILKLTATAVSTICFVDSNGG